MTSAMAASGAPFAPEPAVDTATDAEEARLTAGAGAGAVADGGAARAKAVKIIAAAAVAVAAPLGVAAWAAASRAAESPGGREEGSGDGVELGQMYVTTDYKMGKGCSNWAAIEAESTMQINSQNCAQRCSVVNWCTSSNFQELANDQCVPSPGGGLEQGTCYLYTGDCEEEDNPCWSLTFTDPTVPPTPAPPPGGRTTTPPWSPPPAPPVPATLPATPPPANPVPATPPPANPVPATPPPANPVPATPPPGPAGPPPAPAPATPPPAPPAQEGSYCPVADDFNIHGVAEGGQQPQTRDMGYTITGKGFVSTKCSFDFGNGGWLSYTLDLSAMQTGKNDDKFLSARTFIVLPKESGEYDGNTQKCSAAGRSAEDFCPEVAMLETNGRSAFAASIRVREAEDESSIEPCHTHETVDRSTCRKEGYFSSPDDQCKKANDTKIDVTQPIQVKWVFGEDNAPVVTYSQNGQVVETIRYTDDLDSGIAVPKDMSFKTLKFAFMENGGVFTTGQDLFSWAPGIEDAGCPDKDLTDQEVSGSTMRVDDLQIYARLVRHTCTLCPDGVPPPKRA